MARIKLQLPEHRLGSFSIPVRITDLNYGKHVGNDAIVQIIHEARVQFLSSHGLSELEAGGTALIMSDLAVEYKNESFYGDIISVHVFLGEVSRVGFELFYSLTAVRDEKKIVIALGKTGMICYNYDRKAMEVLPVTLKSILEKGA